MKDFKNECPNYEEGFLVKLIPEKKCNIFNMDTLEFVEATPEELFNTSIYTDIKIVSYVASTSFFEKMISKFETVETIIGIDDSKVCSSVLNGIMANYEVKGLQFFEECTDDLKNRIVDEKVKVRFCKNGSVVHSKIYLLSGNGKYLMMCGSSNLSNNAFGLGRNQYEELLISTNPKVYDMFLERYKYIYQDTIDYIPERCKRLWKEEHRHADMNEQVDIKIDYIDENRDSLDITTEYLNELKELSKREIEGDVQEAERVVKFINTAMTPAKNKIKSIKEKEELVEIKPLISKINVTRAVREGEEKYLRTELIYSPEENELFGMRPGIDNGNSIKWGECLTNEQIQKRITLIDQIVSIYKDHTIDNNINNAKKAYEIILHAYFSPFMWKMRGDCQNYYAKGEKNIAAEVANILVVNGIGKTGKSAIISAINKMLQNSAFEIPKWQEYKKDIRVMDASMKENNVYPLIIDEIEKDFIGRGNSNWKGERWIKSVSNEIGDEAHPYMITASNQSIDLTSPLRRRVNYISLNSKLDGTPEMKSNLSKYIGEMDNLLFKDFCRRMLKKIEEEGSLYKQEYEQNGIRDFIYPAREIFKEYYEECGMEIPEFFPEQPFDDYSYNGKMMWRDTFLDKMYVDAFNYMNGELIVNMEELSNKMYSKKPDKLKAYLNEYTRKEGDLSESNYIHLDAEKFFVWIEIENPYVEKKGIFDWLLKYIG